MMIRGRLMRRRSTPLSAVFLVAALGLTACTDEQPTGPVTTGPSFNRLTAPGQQRATGVDAEFARIAQNARGFGGMFYDANGRLNVYITKEGLSPQGRQAVLTQARASLQSRGRLAPMPGDIAVLEGTRDYVELTTLRERMNPVLAESGVVFTDIDEVHNRLRVGVLAGTSPAQIQAMVHQLGVPVDAVSIEVTKPIVPFANLLGALNPIGAGLQIWSFIPPTTASICTLGFNVRLPAPNKGERYFFTNSHCTEERGTVTGTQFRQGPLSLSTRTVAVEVADPPFFACAPGFLCRFSDAALAQYAPEAAVKLGMIYQTMSLGTDASGSLETLVPGKAFSIVADRDFPVVGEVLDKVGRTTGWTRGPVIATCVNVLAAETNPPVVMLCQDAVAAVSGGGDSGSPVFQPTTSNSKYATLYGILWGGTEGLYVFSALDNIHEEFGSFRTH